MLSLLRKKAKGFTLIELLIVVAIIGILAAIAIPNLLAAQARSKNSRAATDTKQIVTQAQLYINDNNQMPGAGAPALLWNKGAPGNTIYMAATYDPWGTTATTNYGYTEAGASTTITGEVVSYSIGSGKAGAWTLPGLCGTGAIGYSSQTGKCGY